MPNLSRLELKPSPREFDLEKFNEYVEELKKNKLRSELFVCILRNRDFNEIREINADNSAKADLEINQCLLEALDAALNTPDEDLDAEFEMFNQEFKISGYRTKSPLGTKNNFYF